MPYGFKKSAIAEKANAVKATLTGDFAQVQRIVDDAELVIAIWPDKTEKDGAGTMVVKGANMLRDIALGSKSRDVRWNAIPCVCLEQAEALRLSCDVGSLLH